MKLTQEQEAAQCYGVALSGPALMFFLASGVPAGRAFVEKEDRMKMEAVGTLNLKGLEMQVETYRVMGAS
jgi:hypothetical protein